MRIKNMFAPEGSKGLDQNCIACGLHAKCKTPQMEYSGSGELGILIVSEAPTKRDDENGSHLEGTAGRFLTRELSKFGLRFKDDFWKTNAVLCKPPGKKPPTDKQIMLCRDNLVNTIEKLQPRFIWAFGNIPNKSLIGKALKSISISSLCNRAIPLKEFDAWLMPMLHPSFIVRNEHDANLKGFFRRNLKMAIDFWKEDYELPNVSPFDGIEFLSDPEDLMDVIDDIRSRELLSAFDFETTGLHPWFPGHKVTSLAIATEEKSYAIPIHHPDALYLDEGSLDITTEAIQNYIEDPELTIVGQDVSFDLRWSEWIFDTVPEGTFPCTQSMSHILDHRTGYAGLKDQAFLRWGIVNYDKATDGYIKSTPGSPFNKMCEMPLEEQLLYVGADARLTLMLYKEQLEEMTEGQIEAAKFFNTSLSALRDIQNNGIIVDVEYYEDLYDDLTEQIENLEFELNHSKDARDYEKRYKKKFLYSSPNDLKRLLFEMRKIESVKLTSKGNDSVDEEALLKIDYWLCNSIIEVRKLTKLRDTYVSQYIRYAVDGVIHPTFRLNIARSFRSSCTDPNVQNTPKRNKRSKKLIRSGMIPPRGWKMFEVDFSGMEVGTSAMYHKDPTFIEYLVTPGSDMHRDNTCDIWKIIDTDLVTDLMRFYGKNLWTFAQFYGDYFGSCGTNLWNICLFEEKLEMADGTLLKDWIFDLGITELGVMEKGIPTPGSFLEHCKNVENKMWNERFPVYTQWKKDINDFYNKNGYTESLLGFRYDGYMDRKQVPNYLIQGTAFHLLMWCLYKINDILKRENWESYLIGEVHDSMMGYVHPAEEQDLWYLMKRVCTKDLLNRFSFINVPMDVDIEVSETNGNFSELTKVKL